jgi:hypothetical protein
MGDVRKSDLGERQCGECGAVSDRAVQDDSAAWFKFLGVHRQGRIGAELEHAARNVHRARDCAVHITLGLFAHIDEDDPIPPQLV